jgi:ASC-1-like (ASCH) protein
MKQYEAVIKVMEKNGGYSTLAHLYQNALKVQECKWKTKTPFASIRRIVQEKPFFFKIKPGLWALKTYRDKLPQDMITTKKKTSAQVDFTHSYYQGLIVQVGNLRRYDTFVPNQDKNKSFLPNESLGKLTSLKEIYQFCYPNTVRRAKTIDVIWFNERKMPASIFEVEHSTDMKNSLIKFVELQDFRTNMVIVAQAKRKRLFQDALSLNAFQQIKKYVRFLSYEQLSDYHSHLFKLKTIGKDVQISRW